MANGRDEGRAAQRRAELAAGRAHDDDVIRSGAGRGDTFGAVFQRRISRRGFLKAGAAAASLILAPKLAVGEAQTAGGFRGRRPAPGIGFSPLAPQPATSQWVHVADGYGTGVLLAWGDPLTTASGPFDPTTLTGVEQEQRFGYNCDYIGWHEMSDGKSGLLWVNHEYTNEELMFSGYDPANPTKEQVDIGLAAHGGTIVEIQRDQNGRLRVELGSQYNRRIHAKTPMRISGPAAGHEWMKTSEDPTGYACHGMFNNCAGGITPWGTVLSAEENFHQYFGNLDGLPEDDPRWAVHDRYGMPGGHSDRLWERYYPRFNVAVEPNEGFRAGWIVEIDPFDPESTPVKRTALGRFRHEGGTFGYSPSGRVAFYSGDDSRFEYVYKYVSDDAYDPLKRGMGQGLLDKGTLYVAIFNDDGTGEWIPLRYGEDPLTEANGFTSQGDVLIKTRLAADAVSATKMDRPEDIQQNPVNHKVYGAFTNNTARTEEEVDPANPRAENAYGHIIEITEDGDDAAAESFTWDIFILCGDPADESTYFAGFPKDSVSPIACPDNVNFDAAGNLWISTDGQPGTLELADGLYCVPTEGEQRGNVQLFLSVVDGGECASFEFTTDNRSLVVSVQHPGEGGTYEEPTTTWPHDGTGLARPSVIQVWAENGGRIGES
jgi:secreted PhoX family phosphatase